MRFPDVSRIRIWQLTPRPMLPVFPRITGSITLSRNGTTENVSGYNVGGSYTLPGAGADVNGAKHVGWSTVTIPTPGSKPVTNYYELGAEIKLAGFWCYERGEGLEKREDNFGDEIASMLNK